MLVLLLEGGEVHPVNHFSPTFFFFFFFLPSFLYIEYLDTDMGGKREANTIGTGGRRQKFYIILSPTYQKGVVRVLAFLLQYF